MSACRGRWRRAAWRTTWLLLCWLTVAGAAQAGAPPACAPVVQAVWAAPALASETARPDHGWEAVTLPDLWARRWPAHVGAVWYRIDWMAPCADAAKPGGVPLGLGIDGMGIAGEVYLNDDLLWRDRSMVEPLVFSWNSPRWWLLPRSALNETHNTIWVRTVGPAELASGLGQVRIGLASDVDAVHADNLWRQRTVHYLTIGISGAMGVVFLTVWFLRRSERAYGWYALMSWCWVLYLGTLLATSPWPLPDILAFSRLNNIAFLLYVFCFCRFTWRFGAQHLPRAEWLLNVGLVVGVGVSLLAPRPVVEWAWITAALVFALNCMQFLLHACRTRDPQHLLLALCWLALLVVGIHDFITVMEGWASHETWSAVTGPVGAVSMGLLLGTRLVTGMRRIDQFNRELQASVDSARAELADVLAREHTQALTHAALRERLRIVHDLHDGLGGSLVRSLALVEQSAQPLSNERMLSMLKTLRDDLRQVIDQGASEAAAVPATPVQWMAPLRHRFARLLEEMGVASEWYVDEQWRPSPSALQCLGLARLVEESLSNVIKHSRATQVTVRCVQDGSGCLSLRIEDDGVGFDIHAVQAAGLSVGVRSMQARAIRLGGQCVILSNQPRGTVVAVTLAMTDEDRHPVPVQACTV